MEKIIFASFLLLVGYGVAMTVISLTGGAQYPVDVITAVIGSILLTFHVALLAARAVRGRKKEEGDSDPPQTRP